MENKNEDYGKINYEKREYKLLQNAYLTGTGDGHYEALAMCEKDEKDANGNQKKYRIIWKIKEDYNPCDEPENACDWDEPYEVKS